MSLLNGIVGVHVALGNILEARRQLKGDASRSEVDSKVRDQREIHLEPKGLRLLFAVFSLLVYILLWIDDVLIIVMFRHHKGW